jgi:hypothetical protein
LVSKVKLISQTPKGRSTIHRVEIFALQVLNEGQLGRLAIIDQLDDCRDFLAAKLIHSAPATLASNQLIPARGAV